MQLQQGVDSIRQKNNGLIYFSLSYLAATGFLTSIGATNFWCTAKATITITSVETIFFTLSVENIVNQFLKVRQILSYYVLKLYT